MDFPDHPFWDFSLRVHERAGVFDACLALQRRYGLDVNLLFFCCWAGVCQGRPLGREGVGRAVEAVAGWQEEVVRPVWGARWRLKGGFGAFPTDRTEPLRKALIAAELDAEHMEQLQLAETVPLQQRDDAGEEEQLAAAADNLARCLEACLPEGVAAQGRAWPDDAVEPLAVLLSGVFPDLATGRIRGALQNVE